MALLYNPEAVEQFLTENYPNPKTALTYRRVLEKLSNLGEFVYNKNLYDFSYNEMDMTLASCGAKTLRSAIVIRTVANKYVEWARQNNLSRSYIDFSKFMTKEDALKSVNKIAQNIQYIRNPEELRRICDFCINPQDAIIFVLLYIGIKGEGNSELLELKVNNCKLDLINGKTCITIERKGKICNFELNEWQTDLLNDALRQDVYYSNNGETTSRNAARDIAITEYVLRSTKNARSKGDQLSNIILNSKIKKIANKFDERNTSYLNPKNIHISGMFYTIWEDTHKLEVDTKTIKEYAERWGIGVTNLSDVKKMYKTYAEQTAN